MSLGNQLLEIWVEVVLHVSLESIDADDAAERKVVQEEQGRATFPRTDFENPDRFLSQRVQQFCPKEKMVPGPVG